MLELIDLLFRIWMHRHGNPEPIGPEPRRI
jgi:hypothetical protein